MCVIVHKPAGKSLTEKDIRLAYENNQHGFGFMYFDKETNRIVAKKSLDYKEDDIVKVFEELKDIDVVFHYRYKTDGEIINSQCHPFRILDKKRNGMDMYFMHNGVIHSARKLIENKESDTQAFCRNFLQPMLRKAPSLIETAGFQTLIEEYIGKNSKLVFMYGNGKVIKINEEAGTMRDDCWVSNVYSFREGHRTPAKNQTGGTGVRNTTTGGTTNSNVYPYSSAYYNRQEGISHPPSSNTPDTNLATDGASRVQKGTFVHVPVKIGDEVWVWHHHDDDFLEEGTITSINQTTTYVKFKNEVDTPVTLPFYNDDGNTFNQRGNTYYAVPGATYDTDSTSKKVHEDHEFNNRHTSDEPDKKKSEGEEDGIEEAVQTVSQLFEEADSEDNSEHSITYAGETINPHDRYNGMIEGPEDYYGVNQISIQDVYDMDVNSRFEFFCDHPEEAFNMWQDLVENIVEADTEFLEERLDKIAMEGDNLNPFEEEDEEEREEQFDDNQYLDQKFRNTVH